MLCDCGAYISLDICTALHEVEEIVCQQGTTITYIKRGEPDVQRDSLNAVNKRSLDTRYRFKAFPLDRYPDYKRLERAGLREGVEAIAYTPMSQWIEYGLIRTPTDDDLSTLGEDFAALEIIRSTVILDGTEWRIKDKGLFGRLGPMPLYITLGLAVS